MLGGRGRMGAEFPPFNVHRSQCGIAPDNMAPSYQPEWPGLVEEYRPIDLDDHGFPRLERLFCLEKDPVAAHIYRSAQSR